jgi:hypothetical protein
MDETPITFWDPLIDVDSDDLNHQKDQELKDSIGFLSKKIGPCKLISVTPNASNKSEYEPTRGIFFIAGENTPIQSFMFNPKWCNTLASIEIETVKDNKKSNNTKLISIINNLDSFSLNMCKSVPFHDQTPMKPLLTSNSKNGMEWNESIGEGGFCGIYKNITIEEDRKTRVEITRTKYLLLVNTTTDLSRQLQDWIYENEGKLTLKELYESKEYKRTVEINKDNACRVLFHLVKKLFSMFKTEGVLDEDIQKWFDENTTLKKHDNFECLNPNNISYSDLELTNDLMNNKNGFPFKMVPIENPFRVIMPHLLIQYNNLESIKFNNENCIGYFNNCYDIKKVIRHDKIKNIDNSLSSNQKVYLLIGPVKSESIVSIPIKSEDHIISLDQILKKKNPSNEEDNVVYSDNIHVHVSVFPINTGKSFMNDNSKNTEETWKHNDSIIWNNKNKQSFNGRMNPYVYKSLTKQFVSKLKHYLEFDKNNIEKYSIVATKIDIH